MKRKKEIPEKKTNTNLERFKYETAQELGISYRREQEKKEKK